jgi:hypothetical protein
MTLDDFQYHLPIEVSMKAAFLSLERLANMNRSGID